MKAPRHDNLPFEVGPLARLTLSGAYENGISAIDRTIASTLEAKKITEIMKILLRKINLYTYPKSKQTCRDWKDFAVL